LEQLNRIALLLMGFTVLQVYPVVHADLPSLLKSPYSKFRQLFAILAPEG
jgi:hypothetical protein